MRAIIPALLLCLSCNIYAQMRQIYHDGDENNTAHKIHFLSPSEGFIAFEKWVGYTQDSGRTFVKRHITNSNVNYNNYGVNLTFGFAINGVYAFDRNALLVYGHYGFVPAILSSTDNGNSFTLVYHGVFNPAYLYQGVLDMYFSGTAGYALIDDKILRTTNKGLSWSSIYADANADFLHFKFLDVQKGFAVAKNKIVKTVDGGINWQAFSTPSGIIRAASF